tara:strand:+ start:27 stop:293 length:267 start_codon:yes stop_codon:yes gene_type:complete
MAKQSPRQYYDELSELFFSEEGGSKRADKLFDILEGLGYSSDRVGDAIDSGIGLPSKEKFKTGGMIKRKMGGKVGKPRGWGAARHGNR